MNLAENDDQKKKIPDIHPLNVRAINHYKRLHSQRNREFPSAWILSYETIPIVVDDLWQANYFIYVWDQIFTANYLIEVALKEEKRRSGERMMNNEKILRTV